MADILILGAGMVGTAMAFDFAAADGADVRVADRSAKALARVNEQVGRHSAMRVSCIKADLSEGAEVERLASEADIVLGALPSAIGFATLRTMIRTGTPYVDISFMPENPLDVDVEARQQGALAVVDCGVAPGLSNVLAAQAMRELEQVKSIDIYVGGVPESPQWPFNYKAAFSPRDVIEEYTRPARLVESGRVVVKEALSEPERLEFAGVPGTALEAFNTDGLRTLIDTLLPRLPRDVTLREKTLRYPGHAELMRIFREAGFFRTDAVNVGEKAIRPLDLTAALLFPQWTYQENELDLTVLRVEASGRRDGREMTIVWEMLDRKDPETGFSSMSRTTAYPATFVAREILAGRISGSGIVPPEELVCPRPKAGVNTAADFTSRLFAALAARGITIEETAR